MCPNKEADIQIRQDRFNENHKITVLTSHTSDLVQEISPPNHCGPLSLGDLLSSTLCQSLPFLSPSTFPCSAPNSGAGSHKIYVTVFMPTSFQSDSVNGRNWLDIWKAGSGEKPGLLASLSLLQATSPTMATSSTMVTPNGFNSYHTATASASQPPPDTIPPTGTVVRVPTKWLWRPTCSLISSSPGNGPHFLFCSPLGCLLPPFVFSDL